MSVGKAQNENLVVNEGRRVTMSVKQHTVRKGVSMREHVPVQLNVDNRGK